MLSLHLHCIRPLGRTRHVRIVDILFKTGDTAVPFYVLLSGRMEIVRRECLPRTNDVCHTSILR